ncbi:BDN_1c_G0034010.mRNA.1.CDS.1 [Saccharomyces cerevisiae]|nr:BDN_1c_G0034010.mRNA.1.CDS.1 [Saccharomyces cerevisiae]CAI7320870.1 BDN_1c_G0034010.mRNA.1.CDS.1 [Saccharomyces cerevisiae]
MGHTHTWMLQYIPRSSYPNSHIPLHGPSLTKSVLNALTSLCTALASAVYTLCHLPIMPDNPHFNIYISFHGPQILYKCP